MVFFQVFKDTRVHSFDCFVLSSDVSSVLFNSLTDYLSASKITKQYKTPFNCQTCVSENAVDRDIQTCARMEAIGTTSTDKSTWWYVDIGGRYNVYNIRIQFKDYGDMYSKYPTKQWVYRYDIIDIIINRVPIWNEITHDAF